MRSALITSFLVCVAMVVACTGCGGVPEINGQLALGRDGGHAVVVIHTCRGGVDEIEVWADRDGLSAGQTNPSLGRLRARHAVSGDVSVDVTEPGPAWEVIEPVTLPSDPGRGVVVTAREASAGTETEQVSVRVGQLASLRPGTVLVAGGADEVDGRPTDVQTFRANACPR